MSTPDDAAAPAQDDLLALPAGYGLKEYRIERILGDGGFGITYLAHDTQLDCQVAIKEYLPRDAVVRGADMALRPRSQRAEQGFQAGLQRFLLESRALASFHHIGIVRVLRYFRANDTAYMVMEYVDGQSLQKWLVGRLPLDRATLLRIVQPLLDGLEVIHAAGFLHRDIKPGNIYIRADGSPVLLDFGSARRLEGEDGQEQTMTAVVTPGFAPAEQYHRHGRQGPWTDLYALAGVMYWMISGRLPVEAFARLREDKMPPASDIGNRDVFGVALLKAVDWALHPDENKRPQQVADFRRACLAPPTGGEASDVPVEAPLPLGLSAAQARTFIGAVLFADLPVSAQGDAQFKESRSRLAQMLSQAIAQIPPTTRLAVNTKEGCAVCYVGDPEDALRTAVQLGEAAAGGGLEVQMGINLGPVRVAPDPNGRSRILGDGITTAFRIMRFADPGQVLVARAYFEVIQRLRRNAGECFRHLGLRRDPQAREHEVYAYSGNTQSAGVRGGEPSLRQPLVGGDITPEAVETAERLLAQHIGPMARILVRRSISRAESLTELYQQLAEMIPDPAPRAAFLAGSAVPMTSRAQPSQSLPTSASTMRGGVTGKPAEEGVRPTPASGPPTSLDEAELARIEKLFARHIGPMAKVLVRKESRAAPSLALLCRALAVHIDLPAERQRFLDETGF